MMFPHTGNRVPWCPACQAWHGIHYDKCRATVTAHKRVPDDHLSVCTLHPERTAIARRLLAFLEDD
jgi:hypothetical protein